MGGTIREHIEIYESLSGPRARIIGTRIRVMDIVTWHIHTRMSIEELEDSFPHITLADIHAALVYYWDNKEEVDSHFEMDRKLADEYERKHPSLLQEKLARIQQAEILSQNDDGSSIENQGSCVICRASINASARTIYCSDACHQRARRSLVLAEKLGRLPRREISASP
ncbi:MAG: DUF433 domain-containing protein [Chloroflexi bacterium]|nr:DUF433 domain-containing protein [Chloroflexota bacterium]